MWAGVKVKFAGPQYKRPHFPVYLKHLRLQPLKVRRGQHVSSRVADKSTIIIVTTMSSLIKLSNKHVVANKKLSRDARRRVSQENRVNKDFRISKYRQPCQYDKNNVVHLCRCHRLSCDFTRGTCFDLRKAL